MKHVKDYSAAKPVIRRRPFGPIPLLDEDFDGPVYGLTPGEQQLYTTRWFAVTGGKQQPLNVHK